jgi:hypothetical protein
MWSFTTKFQFSSIQLLNPASAGFPCYGADAIASTHSTILVSDYIPFFEEGS